MQKIYSKYCFFAKLGCLISIFKALLVGNDSTKKMGKQNEIATLIQKPRCSRELFTKSVILLFVKSIYKVKDFSESCALLSKRSPLKIVLNNNL